MNCPKCNNTKYCKENLKSDETKRLAFEMYLEGLDFRAIGRVLGIGYGIVYYWIRRWGKSLELSKRNESIEVVDLDELHSYVCQKNYFWVWIAVDRCRKKYLNFVSGDRSTQTGLKLWDKIKDFIGKIIDYICCQALTIKRIDLCD